MRKHLSSHIWALGFVVALVGCSDEKPGTVVIETSHSVDGAPLVMHDVRYQNAAGQMYSVTKLVYYLSDIELRRTDGSVHSFDVALYNDAEEPSTLQHRFEQVEAGTYNSITFTWGLDAEKNVLGELPDNPQNNSMLWPEGLGGGYHYSKCEGRYDDAGTLRSYATHTGRVKRDIDPEPHHHFFTVTLPISVVVDDNTSAIGIAMDLNQWYEDPNLYGFPEPQMIMGDPDRQRMLMENGATVFSIR